LCGNWDVFYADRTDIVDEAITFFRANVFFRNFNIQSPADKLLIYLTFYINVALKRLEGCRTLAEGTKAIINLGLEKVSVPEESGFPFPGLFADPQSQKEAGKLPFYVFFFLELNLCNRCHVRSKFTWSNL
jgi:actin related protein 2/3 complex subunit 3